MYLIKLIDNSTSSIIETCTVNNKISLNKELCDVALALYKGDIFSEHTLNDFYIDFYGNQKIVMRSKTDLLSIIIENNF